MLLLHSMRLMDMAMTWCQRVLFPSSCSSIALLQHAALVVCVQHMRANAALQTQQCPMFAFSFRPRLHL